MIYFDNASTTKPYEEVISEVADGMRIYFANPSSIHKMGVKCEKRLDESREIISNIINCSRNEVFFTSGGSEGNKRRFVCKNPKRQQQTGVAGRPFLFPGSADRKRQYQYQF